MAKSSSPYYVQTLQALGKFYKFALDTKWKDLPKKTQSAILMALVTMRFKFSYEDGVRSYDTKKPSRAWSLTLNVVFARPKANGRVKNSVNISVTCPGKGCRVIG